MLAVPRGHGEHAGTYKNGRKEAPTCAQAAHPRGWGKGGAAGEGEQCKWGARRVRHWWEAE